MSTKETIIASTIPILAREGYAGTSMRKVAGSIGREPSIIYTHFSDKETLLRETRLYVTKYLDGAQSYRPAITAAELLRDTLKFQFKHREMIVALLQYFMAARQDFQLADGGGYVPDRAYQHMTRVIERGIKEGRYYSEDCRADAKAATHLTNGYLMEYFDRAMSPRELTAIVDQIATFIERSLLATSAMGAR
jgi:AcrR family transcriptional regulator